MQLSSPNADASPFERRVPSSSTLKGTLHKTPPRRRPPELQHTGLEPGTKLHGGMPPTHSEETKTMIKSKRLEPCGRCQVMTAVRVALPGQSFGDRVVALRILRRDGGGGFKN